MYGLYNDPDDKVISNQYNDLLQQADEIYKAFVNVIIPQTPELAEEFGRIQYYGALDLYTDEYLMLSLNQYYIPVAVPMALTLEAAAQQLILTEGDRTNLSDRSSSNIFGTLTPLEQLQALSLLNQLMINIADLPEPFQNNPGFILYITSQLNMLTTMGYYSEWSGYGSTRLESPNQRRLEMFPISWEQVGYPGPSLGYRALRANRS